MPAVQRKAAPKQIFIVVLRPNQLKKNGVVKQPTKQPMLKIVEARLRSSTASFPVSWLIHGGIQERHAHHPMTAQVQIEAINNRSFRVFPCISCVRGSRKNCCSSAVSSWFFLLASLFLCSFTAAN